MKMLREILLHAGVVCSFICIDAKVLDWYNPFMDFYGHIFGFQLALYLIVFVSAILKMMDGGKTDTPLMTKG